MLAVRAALKEDLAVLHDYLAALLGVSLATQQELLTMQVPVVACSLLLADMTVTIQQHILPNSARRAANYVSCLVVSVKC
jgi:hypothetical protein